MTIGNRLLINVLVFLAVAASIYGYFFLRQEQHYAETQAVKRVEAFGESMREILQANLASENLGPLKKLLNRIAVFEQPLGMRVYLKSGDLFYQTKSLKKFPSSPISSLTEQLKEYDSFVDKIAFRGKSYVVCSLPLESRSGTFLGVLQIYDYQTAYENEMRGYHRQVFTTLLLFYTLTLAIIFFAIQKNVDRPMASLLKEVQNASNSKTPGASRRRGHELSLLQQEFRERDTHLHELKHVIFQNSREREALLDQLKQSEKLAAIGKFAAGLAHEMGSPLSVIEGRSHQALRKLEDAGIVKKNLELIAGQSKVLSDMIQDVLLFARRRPIHRSSVDLNRLVHQALELIESSLKNIQTEVRADPDLPKVEVDPDQILQVLSNLLRNAIQAMPQGGRLTLEVQSLSDRGEKLPWVRLSVQDTGLGMDEEVQARLFEPFFSKRIDGSGTGLGLSIVYGIVQEHEGKILVQSRPGAGTRFDIYLPLIVAEPAKLDFETRAALPPGAPVAYYSEKKHG